MKNLIFSILLACSLVLPVLAQEAPEQASFNIDELKRGGYVVFFRHTKRDDLPSKAKMDELDRASSCEPGGSLNNQGEAEARAMARGIKERSIPAGEVRASPTCRTKQMARILVGEDFTIDKTLAPASLRGSSRAEEDAAALKELLTQAVPAGTNRFLISHGKLMTKEAIGLEVSLEQSQAAVFLPDGNGGCEFKGIINPGDWEKEQALSVK